MSGRSYVSPLDVQELLTHCWSHRLQLSDEALYTGITTKNIVNSCLKSTQYHGPTPTQV